MGNTIFILIALIALQSGSTSSMNDKYAEACEQINILKDKIKTLETKMANLEGLNLGL